MGFHSGELLISHSVGRQSWWAASEFEWATILREDMIYSAHGGHAMWRWISNIELLLFLTLYILVSPSSGGWREILPSVPFIIRYPGRGAESQWIWTQCECWDVLPLCCSVFPTSGCKSKIQSNCRRIWILFSDWLIPLTTVETGICRGKKRCTETGLHLVHWHHD